jgi:hypothetical protein
MLLFSQGCLYLDVSGPITAFKQIILRKYFPDENNATDKDCIFDCVTECFTKTNYFIHYVSLITIFVMWISLNKTSMRINRSIIVLWTPFHNTSVGMVMSRRVGRYLMCNQNPYIEEGQTTQWPKEKSTKDKLRSTKHTHTTKDRVTRTPLKIESEFEFSGIVCSFCLKCNTRRLLIIQQMSLREKMSGEKLRQYKQIMSHQ